MAYDPNHPRPSGVDAVVPRSKQSRHKDVDRVERKVTIGMIVSSIVAVLAAGGVFVWAASSGKQTSYNPSGETTTNGSGGSAASPGQKK
jgi:hypothetical protein